MIPARVLKRTTIEQLRKAIDLKLRQDRAETLERQRAKLLKAVAKLDAKLARLNGASPTPSRKRKRWKLSAETRKKMSLAAKRRYGGKRGTAEEAGPTGSGKTRRTISPEARAKMAEAARKRWAKVKGAKAETKEA